MRIAVVIIVGRISVRTQQLQHLRSYTRSNDRGAINTIGVLIGLAIIGIAMAIGVAGLGYQTRVAMATTSASQSASVISALEVRLLRDASSAGAIYFPTTCAATGACDDVRFGSRNPDGTWRFWGYAAVPSSQAIAYCTYALSSATRCTSPLVATGIRAFRIDTIQPSDVTAAIGGVLSGLSPETHQTQVYYNAADADSPRVTTGNVIFVSRFATAQDSGEVHLVPGVIANQVSESNGVPAPPRSIAGAHTLFNFVQGDATHSPPDFTDPVQSATYDVDRYNGSLTVDGQEFPNDGTPASVMCVDPQTSAEVAYLSGSVSNNSSYGSGTGVTAELSLAIKEINPGNCPFNIVMTKKNSNDSATISVSTIVYGPLVASPSSVIFVNPAEATAGVAGQSQTAMMSEANLVEGGQGYALSVGPNTCSGIASVSPASGTFNNGVDQGQLAITSIAPGSCTVTIYGAVSGTKANVTGTAYTLPITVGNYSPMLGVPTSVTLANASKTSSTYSVSEAYDPFPFTFARQVTASTWQGTGTVPLYNASGALCANVVLTSNASGAATFSVSGAGSGGSCTFSVSDGHGQTQTVAVTVGSPGSLSINISSPFALYMAWADGITVTEDNDPDTIEIDDGEGHALPQTLNTNQYLYCVAPNGDDAQWAMIDLTDDEPGYATFNLSNVGNVYGTCTFQIDDQHGGTPLVITLDLYGDIQGPE